MQIEYLRIDNNGTLPDLTFDGFFRAGLISECETSQDRMNLVTDWLYRSGVKYFCTWGESCEQWHDSMDWSNLRACDYNVPDDKHVMTTWDSSTPLDEMLWYLRELAGFAFDGNTPLNNVLILHIADEDRPDLIERFLNADVND